MHLFNVYQFCGTSLYICILNYVWQKNSALYEYEFENGLYLALHFVSVYFRYKIINCS